MGCVYSGVSPVGRTFSLDDDAAVPEEVFRGVPMRLVAVSEVLKMDHLLSQDELALSDISVSYKPSHYGKVIFVSRQWLGWDSPDPDGHHADALKHALKHLMRGDVARAEPHRNQKPSDTGPMSFQTWASSIPSMFLCWDFLDSPYLSVPNSEEFLKANALSYMDRASLMLVVAPPCEHHDTGKVCDLSSWRGEAWCRAELAACMLSSAGMPVVFCAGEHTRPYFAPADFTWTLPWNLPLPPGRLPCCERFGADHACCDGPKLRATLESMLDAKECDLRARGDDEHRALASLRACLLDAHAKGNPEQVTRSFAASEMRSVSKFTPDCVQWLLPYAAASNDLRSVERIVSGGRCRPDAPTWKGPALLGLDGDMTALMVAMRFASFDVVEELLKAAADPTCSGRKVDALQCAVVSAAQEPNVTQWLEQFPTWDLDLCKGTTTLALAAGVGPNKSGIVKVLLSARADPMHADDLGILPIHVAAAKEDADPDVVATLIEAGSLVNAPVVAKAHWDLRLARCFGAAGPWRLWVEGAPLHFAMARGHTSVVRVLVAGGADTGLKNASNMTALDVARWSFGGEVPDLLARAAGVADDWKGLRCASKSSTAAPAPADSAAAAETPLSTPSAEGQVGFSGMIKADVWALPSMDTIDDVQSPFQLPPHHASCQHRRLPSQMTMTGVQGALGVTALFISEDHSQYAISKLLQKGKQAYTCGKNRVFVEGYELGRGSFGRVFMALVPQDQEVIAVKSFPIDEALEADKNFKADLELEVSSCSRLRHPHLLSFLGHDFIDKHFVVYQEQAPGGCLAGALAAFGRFEEMLSSVVIREMLMGLSFLHSRTPPVVHRNIRCCNVLFDIDCKAKLADFGCSKHRSSNLSRQNSAGQLPWIAPESTRSHEFGRASDVWALGCVLIAMASGNRPWGKFDNPMARLGKAKACNEPPLAPEGSSPDCQSFLDACLQPEPLMRLSATDLLAHHFVTTEDEEDKDDETAKELLSDCSV